jgi:hypothetical protein
MFPKERDFGGESDKYLGRRSWAVGVELLDSQGSWYKGIRWNGYTDMSEEIDTRT